jgi:hypothetical protein
LGTYYELVAKGYLDWQSTYETKACSSNVLCKPLSYTNILERSTPFGIKFHKIYDLRRWSCVNLVSTVYFYAFWAKAKRPNSVQNRILN